MAHRIRQWDANTSIYYQGGGKLLANAQHGLPDGLDEELERTYAWLMNASGGKLGMHWTMVKGESSSSEAIQYLLKNLVQAKWKAGRSGAWFGHSGVQVPEPSGSLGDPDWESEVGGRLLRDEQIQGFRTGSSGWAIGTWHVTPVQERPEIAITDRANADVSASIPTYAPRNPDGSVAELNTLAEEGDGAPYLALLKLDGDRIGNLLADSLQHPSWDEYKRISESLSRFFGSEVPKLLQREFPRVYLIYSGGDDLVATGHFFSILRAATAISRSYRKLNLGTLSAGISFYTRNSPILKAVQAAERLLDDAKDIRNAVSVGGCRLSWDELQDAMVEIDALAHTADDGLVNRGIFQKLRQLGEPWLCAAPDDISELRWRSIPQFHYIQSRRDWKLAEWNPHARKLFENLATTGEYWPRAHLVGTLAGWRTKSAQEET